MNKLAIACAMALWACDETTKPEPKTGGQVAASYADKVDELERSTRKRTRWPLCTSEVPEGSPCGLVFSKGWDTKMHAACDEKPDAKSCVGLWMDAKKDQLEARYGGSVEAAIEQCGDECSPPTVELVMLKGYNARLNAEFYRELSRIQTEGMHAIADNAAERDAAARRVAEQAEYNQRLLRGVAAGLSSLSNAQGPQACSNSASCPYNSVCVRAASGTSGFCAAR